MVVNEYELTLIDKINTDYDGVILAVGHDVFRQLDWSVLKGEKTAVFDVKSFLDRSLTDARL